MSFPPRTAAAFLLYNSLGNGQWEQESTYHDMPFGVVEEQGQWGSDGMGEWGGGRRRRKTIMKVVEGVHACGLCVCPLVVEEQGRRRHQEEGGRLYREGRRMCSLLHHPLTTI